MNIRDKIRAAFLSVFLVMLVSFFSPAYSSAIEITGKRNDIDISDLTGSADKYYTETEIKKLCAAIIARYHSLGFTAFSIKTAVLRKDGRVKLVFSDPVVERIIVRGLNNYSDDIRTKIYQIGAVFNEFILQDNISTIKNSYSIKRVTVDLNRTENDNIEIVLTVENKILKRNISILSDPVYGFSASTVLSLNLNKYDFTIVFESTTETEKTGFKQAGFGFLYNLSGGAVYLIADIRVADGSDYVDSSGDSVYSFESTEGLSGFKLKNGAYSFFLTAVSSFAEYNNYSGTDGGLLFTGISSGIDFNDEKFRVDPLDVVTAGIDGMFGWNYIEESRRGRLKIHGSFSVPLIEKFSLSAGIKSDYTSEEERIFQHYIFDSFFPCRNEDFTVSSFRAVTNFGILFEVYDRLIYLSPEYNAGLYDNDDNIEYVYAGGVKVMLISEFFTAEALYSCEIADEIGNGVITFSAKAFF